MSHHQQKVCFDCTNKIETKKFIACIKTFAGKDESHIETSCGKVKSVQKEHYWQGFTLMTDMLIYKTVTLYLSCNNPRSIIVVPSYLQSSSLPEYL